jgi:hypothetical protein
MNDLRCLHHLALAVAEVKSYDVAAIADDIRGRQAEYYLRAEPHAPPIDSSLNFWSVGLRTVQACAQTYSERRSSLPGRVRGHNDRQKDEEEPSLKTHGRRNEVSRALLQLRQRGDDMLTHLESQFQDAGAAQAFDLNILEPRLCNSW